MVRISLGKWRERKISKQTSVGLRIPVRLWMYVHVKDIVVSLLFLFIEKSIHWGFKHSNRKKPSNKRRREQGTKPRGDDEWDRSSGSLEQGEEREWRQGKRAACFRGGNTDRKRMPSPLVAKIWDGEIEEGARGAQNLKETVCEKH